jgi:predicted GNAT family N-acyltransferase
MEVVIDSIDWNSGQHQLLAIRYAVFVDEQGVPKELERDEHDQGALHLIARTADGIAVGTARMLRDGHIGRMAVLPAWRRRGVGSALLSELTRIAGDRGIHSLFLNAQCEAESFYRRFGFVTEGEVFADAGIAHRRMILPSDEV